MKFSISITELIFLTLLIILGVTTRTVFHIAPNVEFVTGSTLAAVYFIQDKKLAWIVPAIIMVVTDVIIGNSLIYLFTWSGFLVMPFVLIIGKLKLIKRIIGKLETTTKLIVTGTGAGVISTFWFYLWTNFGVVVLTTMYSKNITGLIDSYINALPFLKNQLYGNIFIVPSIFLASFIYFECKTILFSRKNLIE